MAHSATLHPFGFSQPSRVMTKTEKRVGTPIPFNDCDRPPRPSTTHRNHRRSISNEASASYLSPSSLSQPRTAAQRPSMQRPFPDEEDDTFQPTRRSRTHETRRSTRLQPSRHTQNSTIVSITPSTQNKRANLQLRITPDMPTIHEAFSEKQLQEQIKEIYSALRRVEDEREKILGHMMAGRADQCRVERELEETRRENHRLTARLEEMLRNSKTKSPLSPRNDDGWGCSMYDMEAEGY